MSDTGPSAVIPSLPPSESQALEADSQADGGLREAALFGSGKHLKDWADENEHFRNEVFRDHFEKVAICALWLISGLFAAVAAIWFWHLLLPERWHWLSPEGVSKIQNIVTGGILTSLATGHFKKRLGQRE